MGECPLCGESTNKPSNRLIKESCGHSKCRLCLLNEESGCSVCEGSSGDISLNTIESIGNFDYRLPATTLSNYEDLDTSPRKLDFNKIPDDFHDCPLDIDRLNINNSITQNLGNVAKPTKVDISTETEDIVTEEEEEEEQSKPIQQNTQLPQPQPTQTSTLQVTNTIRNNHPVQPETPIVQNASFIPVTQRSDGRQFITIAFIANNSPTKNQHVITPLLNQCLPSIGNVATMQRPGGNQCIPMMGNINALQNPAGSQFIIRSPNIVQNLVGNQAISMIGNINAMQNLTGNQSISMIGNVNAAKNLAANQTLPSFAPITAMQSVPKGQLISTVANPNVVQDVVGNKPYETTPTVPKLVENQQDPIEETVNTPQIQLQTRGLPRIKNVKNVNIVQKSATNQSDKISSPIEKRPAKGRRRKQLPVYIVPQKSKRKTKGVPAKKDVDCKSPKFKLEEYLFFNRKQAADNATSAKSAIKTETKTIDCPQIISKPLEPVINVTSVVSDQYDDIAMGKKLEKESEQASKIHNNKAPVSYEETNECKQHHDLNVIFSIRNENKQALSGEICDEEEKLNMSNGDMGSKEEYQNLDVLFDIIEKESKKLNGGIFDREAKHDLSHSKHEENEKMYEKMHNEIDAHDMLSQKEQNRKNNDDNGEIHSSKWADQDKVVEPLKKPTLAETEVSNNLQEMNHDEEQNLVGNFEMQHIDEKIGSEKEKFKTRNIEMTYDEEKNIALSGKVPSNKLVSSFVNDESDLKESSQPVDEETNSKPISTGINKDLHCQNEESLTRREDDDEVNYNMHNSQCVDTNDKDNEEINHALYEDISDEEKDDELLNTKLGITNRKNDDKEDNNLSPDEGVVEKENQKLDTKVVDQNERQELETERGEINDEEASNQCLEETAVEKEDHILDTKVDYQDEEKIQSSTADSYQDGSQYLEDNQDSPANKTNDLVNNELCVVGEGEQSEVTEKCSTSEPEILHKDITESNNQFLQSSPTSKRQDECDPEDLPTKISNLHERNEENKSTPALSDGEESDETDYTLRLDINDEEEEESSQAYDNSESTLTEKQISESSVDNLQTIVVKKRRGRKKKSLSLHELNSEPEKSQENDQVNHKKPRGRPKKSLTNVEQLNPLEESEQPTSKEFSREEKQDECKSLAMAEEVLIHTPEVESKNSKLDLVHNGDEKDLDSNVKSNLALIERIDPQDKDLELIAKNKQAIIIKKRGRPKQSLSIVEQPNILPEVDLPILTKPSVFNDSKNEDDVQQLNKKNKQDMKVEVLASSVNNSEQESLHSKVNANTVLTTDINSSDFEQSSASDNIQPLIIKKHSGRPKKSLSNDEHLSTLNKAYHVDEQPTAVKKQKGRPKKSLKSLELNDVSREVNHSVPSEISHVSEDKHEYYDEKNNSEDIQDETSQHSSSNVHEEEQASLHLAMTESSDFTHKNDSESIISKKRKVDAKKSVHSSQQNDESKIYGENVQPVVVKKRGRPKKSVSNFAVAADISHGKIDEAEYKDHDFNQDAAGQTSSLNMNYKEESLHSDAITSPCVTNKNNSDLVIVKKKGRPKKSLDISQQQNESKICDENVQPMSVKKRGRPKKSLSNLEQPNVVEDHQSDERNENEHSHVVNDKEIFDQEETSQHSSIDIDIEGKGSTDSEIIASSTSTDKSESVGGEQPDIAPNNDVAMGTEKSNGRPEKLQQTFIKKARGRPKKSVSNLEQPSEISETSRETEHLIESEVSGLNHKDHKAQSLNGTIDTEENQNFDADSVDEDPRTSKIFLAEDNLPNENIVEAESNVRKETEHSTVIVKAKGRPKKIVKPRGRPKKSINEQHEHLDGCAEELKSIPNSHDQENINQIETHSFDGKEQSTYQAKEIDEIPSEIVSDKAVSVLSKDNSEVHIDKDESRTVEKDIDTEEVCHNVKVQDDENKENKEKCAEKVDGIVENVTSTVEQAEAKTSKTDSETPKNNPVVKKYKSFDKINTQLIVESGKRKRKPKVLLYENEDLEISTKKRKKRDSNTNTPLKTGNRKSLDKVKDKSLTGTNESSLSSKGLDESSEIKVEELILNEDPQDNDVVEGVEELKEPSQNDESLSCVNENPVKTDSSDSNIQADNSPQNDEDKKSTKRIRRPKILLYENEGLEITPKIIKKKKVAFTLPNDKDSAHSNNMEKIQNNNRSINSDENMKKEDTLDEFKACVSAEETDLMNENEILTFSSMKNAQPSTDSTLREMFAIRMEPIVVLDRIIDSSFIEKYDPRIGQYMRHESQQTDANPKTKVTGKKINKQVVKKPKGKPQTKNYSHIVQLPDEPTFYQCTICKQLFKSWSLRTLHLACAKSSIIQTNESKATIRIHNCEFCPRKFYKATHLQYHERMHKNEKPFSCNICGKKFVQKYKLNRHMTIHGSPDLECAECGKKFVSKEYLKSHLMSHVQSSFIFSCNHCPKSFNLDSSRKRHELSHSPVAPFKCTHCPKSFKTIYEVASHEKRHAEMRPFECSDCCKAFVTKDELKRHKITHSGEKKYSCQQCQQKYGRYDNYKRHIVAHHQTTDDMQYSEETNYNTPEDDVHESSNEESTNQLDVKPKKIPKTSSVPKPMAIKFVQPLTPQTVPSLYLASQNHELASVIRETLPDLMNAVPVISAPISAQPSSSLTEPIPLEQALVLNRQIEEKIYTQNSICEFPGLTRRSVTIVSRRPSYTHERRNSSGSNSNSNDDASFLTMNQQRFEEKPVKEIFSKNNIHVHWRRRTAETYKSKMNENQ